MNGLIYFMFLGILGIMLSGIGYLLWKLIVAYWESRNDMEADIYIEL